MTITKHANGTTVSNSSHADALADLREQYPDMVTHNDGHRTLVWADEASAHNDDGRRELERRACHAQG